MLKDILGKDGFVWSFGVVEDRKDPLFLGRCRVRWVYYHKKDKQEIPTADLPWSMPIIPLDSGKNTVGPKEGDYVFGFFKDGLVAQEPVMVGIIPGIPETKADPEVGFNDPTPDAELDPTLIPRPPIMSPVPTDEESADGGQATDAFSDPNQLPEAGTAFGVLVKDFDPTKYPYDVNKDGVYDSKDAYLISYDQNRDGTIDKSEMGDFVENYSATTAPMSRYPLETELKEPTTNRFERGEDGDGKISETIVEEKKSKVTECGAAQHESSGIGTDAPSEAEPATEPATPYKAKYPYNHAYYSESGHLQEVDDTPKAERIHRYHRAGTFDEVHPDGTQVTKTVSKKFTVVAKDWYASAKKVIQISAGKILGLLGSEGVNIESGGDLNLTSSGNINIFAKKKDINIRASNVYGKVDGEHVQIQIDGDVELLVKGNWLQKVEGNFKLEVGGLMDISAATMKILGQQYISTVGTPMTFLDQTFGNIHATDSMFAEMWGYSENTSPVVAPPVIGEPTLKTSSGGSSSSTLRPGFVLDGAGFGDLWKPISDSDGKAVSLSNSGTPHVLYEAVPTGELEEVTIQYFHGAPTMKTTSWTVKRPKHIKGAIIDKGRCKSDANNLFGNVNGEGGRWIFRWSKPGASYPKQMILKTGGAEWLLLDASIRHD